MKTRIIVAVIAIPILLAVIFFTPLVVFGIVVGLIAAGASWELLRCMKKDGSRRIVIYTAASAFLLPVCMSFGGFPALTATVLFLMFALVFAELMLSFASERRLDADTVTAALLAGFVMPVMISALVRLGLRDNSHLYIIMPFIAAFSSDSGAYFVGKAFGKHKMTPHLSPHKTMEGALGGFVSAVVLMLVYGLILRALGYNVSLAVMAVYGFMGSLACQAGDLSFSAIKRLNGVKDYGNLIPGHGGMLDRFDSTFFTAPMIELLVLWVPAIL